MKSEDSLPSFPDDGYSHMLNDAVHMSHGRKRSFNYLEADCLCIDKRGVVLEIYFSRNRGTYLADKFAVKRVGYLSQNIACFDTLSDLGQAEEYSCMVGAYLLGHAPVILSVHEQEKYHPSTFRALS